MGLLARAQAKASADNLVPLIGALEAYLSDHERKAEIARTLRELREASPYTQEGVAERIGVSLRGYQKMEQTGGVSYPNLVKLADLYGVPIDSFYKGAQPAQSQLDRIEALLSELLVKIDANHALLLALDGWRAERQSSADPDPAGHRAAS